MTVFTMRQPCSKCECPYGRVEPKNGQACVFCTVCGTFAYNAPRTETGERQRSVSTVHGSIKPKVRARVLLRANSRCEMCGIGADAEGVYLHVGHLISVLDGLREGLTEDQLNHQENLIAACESCNLGLGDESVPLRMLFRVTALRLAIRRATA